MSNTSKQIKRINADARKKAGEHEKDVQREINKKTKQQKLN
jgi:hypothetical protein